MAGTTFDFKVREVTLGDIELFEKLVGTKLLDAIAPRVIKDPETGKPIPDPDDDRGRPLLRINMTTREMFGLVLMVMRQENRAREHEFVDLDVVRGLKLLQTRTTIDWSTDDEAVAEENPTARAEASTDSSLPPRD